MENTWVDIASKFGLPVALLLLLIWGAYQALIKLLWPFLVKQIEEAQAQLKLQTGQFIDTIRQRDNLMAESHRENMKALGALTDEIRCLSGDVQDLRNEVKGNRR